MITATRGRDAFAKYKRALDFLTRLYKLLPLQLRKRALEKRRYTRGKIGLGLRYSILKSITDSIGDNVAIFSGVYLLHPENLILGSNISIQPMCYLECGDVIGGITIKDDVSIAHGVTIMATSHTFFEKNEKIRDQKVINEPVLIEEDVWIGAKASILSGVTVGHGCVIGAGAVVTKPTDPDGIYVGVPARRIKGR